MKLMRNHNIIFILIFVALILISIDHLDARVVKEGVRGEGKAAVVGITAEQARLIALQRARADAVEKAAGIKVLGSTLIRNFLLVGQYLKTFSHGFIVDEKVKWLPLASFRDSEGDPPIPMYRVEIITKVMIPERKIDPGFFLEASVDRPSYLSGEEAVIEAKVSRKAHLAIFNLRADDKVVMLYPSRKIDKTGILKPHETFYFPPQDSGLVLEMDTLKGHKIDSEAFMVAAVPEEEGGSFRFLDYFSGDRLYSVPKFFDIYSRIAEFAVEEILPYEVRMREKE